MVPFSLTNDHLHHGADCRSIRFIQTNADKRSDSPYEGMMFNNWPRYTIIRGKIVWAEGKLCGSPKDGEYLKRQASQLTMSAVKSIANDKRRVATWLYDNNGK